MATKHARTGEVTKVTEPTGRDKKKDKKTTKKRQKKTTKKKKTKTALPPPGGVFNPRVRGAHEAYTGVLRTTFTLRRTKVFSLSFFL